MQISFIPSTKETEDLVPRPLPAKNYIPDWYKNIKLPKNIEISNDKGIQNSNVKMCTPFLDTLISGYIQETWCDIYIDVRDVGKEKEIFINHASGPEIIGIRDKNDIPIPEEFYPIQFFWLEQWIPKLPNGFSILTTMPFNRTDLPFFSLSAIIDSDKYFHEYNGRHPFLIKRDFTGIIPSGTPMYQILPIKRESWSAKYENFNYYENRKRKHSIRKNFLNSYKNKFWQKKDFK